MALHHTVPSALRGCRKPRGVDSLGCASLREYCESARKEERKKDGKVAGPGACCLCPFSSGFLSLRCRGRRNEEHVEGVEQVVEHERHARVRDKRRPITCKKPRVTEKGNTKWTQSTVEPRGLDQCQG